MKFLIGFITTLLSFTLAHSSNTEKIYMDWKNIQTFDIGFYFMYEDDWYFTTTLQLDSTGPYIIKTGSRIFGMWWCSTCEIWISDDCVICPKCGEEKCPVVE